MNGSSQCVCMCTRMYVILKYAMHMVNQSPNCGREHQNLILTTLNLVPTDRSLQALLHLPQFPIPHFTLYCSKISFFRSHKLVNSMAIFVSLYSWIISHIFNKEWKTRKHIWQFIHCYKNDFQFYRGVLGKTM